MAVEAVVTAKAVEEVEDPSEETEETRIKTQIIILIETTLILQTIQTQTRLKIKVKVPTPNLIKKAPGPVQMFQTVPVLVTGKKAGMQLIVVTLWSVVGSTSLHQEKIEKWASLD